MTRVPVSRRGLLLGGSGLAVAGAVSGVAAVDRARRAEIALYSETVAFSSPGERHLVPAGRADSVVPGTRVLAGGSGQGAMVSTEQQWLEECAPWARRAGDDVLTSALLDLRVLSTGLPVAVAGWSPRWRYAWPRDVSFFAAALARLRRTREAVDQLRFLQEVQAHDGWFEARYDIVTLRPPDDRVEQLDGSGWVLWAADQVAVHGGEDPAEALAPLRALLVRSAVRLLESIDPVTGLPPASSDYWELVESRLTLGTAAVVLAGLRCASRVLPLVHGPELAERAGVAADALAVRVTEGFAARGYPRTIGGDASDAAITFLLAPIGEPQPPLSLLGALERAQTAMARPAGGLAPGASWKADGISWTPETALFALAWAANGFPEKAEALLAWLGRHRTEAGSFPEKVLHDGRPAAVAPLAWTAASVVLARHELVRA